MHATQGRKECAAEEYGAEKHENGEPTRGRENSEGPACMPGETGRFTFD